MALTAGELAQIVWAETRLFGPGAADGTGDVNFVRLSIAELAASTGGAGFDRRAPLPSVDDARFGKALKQVMQISERATDAPAPQRRLIVWPAGPETAALNTRTDPPPPEPWASLDPATLARQMRLEIAGGPVDVFSRPPGAADPDEAPLVNWLSGTGLPQRKNAEAGAPAAGTRPRPKGIAWTLGIAGVCLFILAGLVTGVTGTAIATARNALGAASPAYERALILGGAALCQADRQDLPGAKRTALCETLLPGGETFRVSEPSDAERVLGRSDAAWPIMGACARDPKGESCALTWRASMNEVASRDWHGTLFRILLAMSNAVTGAGADGASISIAAPYLATLIGIAALIIALGLGTQSRVAGVWIDTRNRVSLARAQVTTWTVVVLGAYFVLTMFDVGFAGILTSLSDFVSGSYEAFPSFPAPIAAALGISGGSTILSSLILPTKDRRPALDVRDAVDDLRKRGAPFFGNQSSGLDKRGSPADASLADLFMGEENANADVVDVARLQNVIITISLAFSYGALLFAMMSNVSVLALLGGRGAVFTGLPDPGANFVAMLAVSHATYLVAKAYDPHDKGVSPETSR